MFKGFNMATEDTLKSILQVVYNNFARRKDVVELKQHVKDEVTEELKELTNNLKNENQKTVANIKTLETSTKEKSEFVGAKAQEISEYAQEVKDNFTHAQELQQVTKELQESATATEEETKALIDEFKKIRDSLSTAVLYKGSVDTYADLPSSAKLGWMYNIKEEDKEKEINAGDNLIWNGESWDNMGGFIDPEDILNGAHDTVFGNVKANSVTADTFKGTATKATQLFDPTGVNGILVNDNKTENNTATWIPVLQDGKIQHTDRTKMTVGAANRLNIDAGNELCLNGEFGGGGLWFGYRCDNIKSAITEYIFGNGMRNHGLARITSNGATFTDDIKYTGTDNHTWSMIRFIDSVNDPNGKGISIGGGGLTIIGGGEAAEAVKSVFNNGADERLVLANDSIIDFYTNTQNGVNSGWHGTIDGNGNFSGNAATASNIYNSQPRLANASESNEIAIRDNANGSWEGTLPSIRKSLDFDWYNTRWSIGSIRGSSTDTMGFGFGYKADKTKGYTTKAWIDTSGTYHGNITGNAATTTRLPIRDTRAVNKTPQQCMTDYNNGLHPEFKQKSVIGIGGSGTYVGVLTFNQWGDSSGGFPSQIACDPQNGRMYYRWSTSATAWSGWKTVAYTDDKPTTAGTATYANRLNIDHGNELCLNGDFGSGYGNHLWFGYRCDGLKSAITEYKFADGMAKGSLAQVTASQFNGKLNGDCTGSAGSVAWGNVTGKPALVADKGTYSTVYVNDWFRANNNCGLYFQKWGGGWYMTDTSWIRAYNNKGIATDGALSIGGDTTLNKVTSRGKVVHADYAEYFQKEKETEINIGDIVALNTEAKGKERYVKATEDSKILVGVHTDEYAMVIGGNDNIDPDEEVPISLMGRVWVNVTGNPKIGDKITASKIPGVGRTAKEGERSVGIVLTEPKDGKVRILIDLKQ